MSRKISIIIPVYNSEKNISECFESIVSQIGDDEIIIINDGSTDKSELICEEYAEKYKNNVKYYSTPNNGVSAARNLGIEKATGNWIMFVDSDDLLTDRALEKIHDALDETTDVLYCNYCTDNEILTFSEKHSEISPELAIKSTLDYVGNIKGISEVFAVHNMIFTPCWGKVYKKALLKENNIAFNTDLSLSEDMCFNINCLKAANKVKTYDFPIYRYIINSDSVTHNFSIAHIKNRKKLIEYLKILKFESRECEQAKNKYILLCIIQLCEKIFTVKERKAAILQYKHLVCDEYVQSIIAMKKNSKLSDGRCQDIYYKVILLFLKRQMIKTAVFVGHVYSKFNIINKYRKKLQIKCSCMKVRE